MEKFKYVVIIITNDDEENKELYIQIGKASVIMPNLHHLGTIKQELSNMLNFHCLIWILLSHSYLWSPIMNNDWSNVILIARCWNIIVG